MNILVNNITNSKILYIDLRNTLFAYKEIFTISSHGQVFKTI